MGVFSKGVWFGLYGYNKLILFGDSDQEFQAEADRPGEQQANELHESGGGVWEVPGPAVNWAGEAGSERADQCLRESTAPLCEFKAAEVLFITVCCAGGLVAAAGAGAGIGLFGFLMQAYTNIF